MATQTLSLEPLYNNPLSKEALKIADIKPLVVGQWGTVPGQNFIHVQLNRIINKYDLNMFHVASPGQGGAALAGNVHLEGAWSEVYPNVTQDEAGLKQLFKQFSFPGGISSHVAPTTQGSIHEGGELGYSLSHAFGAAFDNPDPIVARVIGDGEAETGPLATSWQSNKFLDPITDGAVLPILRLHEFTYARANRNLHVLGYVEEGTITTPFDMRAQNKLDRFQLVQDVVDLLPHLGSQGDNLKQTCQDKPIENKQYIDWHRQGMPEIRNGKWSGTTRGEKPAPELQYA